MVVAVKIGENGHIRPYSSHSQLADTIYLVLCAKLRIDSALSLVDVWQEFLCHRSYGKS